MEKAPSDTSPNKPEDPAKDTKTPGEDSVTADNWSGVNPTVATLLQEVGATCRPPPEQDARTTVEVTCACQAAGEDAVTHVTVQIPEATRRLLQDVTVLYDEKWENTRNPEGYVTYRNDDTRVDWSLPAGCTPVSSHADPLPFPAVGMFADEMHAWQTVFDVSSGCEDGDPFVVRVDHAEWDNEEDYTRMRFSRWLQKLTRKKRDDAKRQRTI